MFGLALFKNEEDALHLALLGSHTLRSLQMAYRTTGTNGTNLERAVLCSLQMEHRSAASFRSIGAIPIDK